MKDRKLTETLLEMKIPNFYGMEHKICQYVDDSNNIIGADNNTELQIYIGNYHKLLEHYYTANKIKMNKTKTKFIITKSLESKNPKVRIKVNKNECLGNDLPMKILGFWRNSKGSLDTHLGKVSATAAKALNDIKPYLKHLNTNKRKEVVYSKCASFLTYGLELLFGQNQ